MTLAVGGLVRFSTCDYPGHLAAVVFCQGCPWRCRYCHNPHLLPVDGAPALTWQDIRAFLETRRGLLDAVVFSGGEPLLQSGLPAAVREVRALGFRVGLHTGGIYPGRLARLVPWLDWVGLDVKAGFADYERITGVAGSGKRARASVELLLASGVAHELRTTIHPALMHPAALLELGEQLAAMGVSRYFVQAFRPTGVRDSLLTGETLDYRAYREVLDTLAGRFRHFGFRPA